MKTRLQYLAGECTHREYYAQFVTDKVKSNVIRYIGRINIETSNDKSFNDIPLRKWANIGIPVDIVDALKEAGDGYSLAGAVCINKEAAKQIRENQL